MVKTTGDDQDEMTRVAFGDPAEGTADGADDILQAARTSATTDRPSGKETVILGEDSTQC
jgi:hypothetical protein